MKCVNKQKCVWIEGVVISHMLFISNKLQQMIMSNGTTSQFPSCSYYVYLAERGFVLFWVVPWRVLSTFLCLLHHCSLYSGAISSREKNWNKLNSIRTSLHGWVTINSRTFTTNTSSNPPPPPANKDNPSSLLFPPFSSFYNEQEERFIGFVDTSGSWVSFVLWRWW